MRKLYWKIFIWFWIATILTIIATALLSSNFTRHSSNRLADRAVISSVYEGAIIMLKNQQQAELIRWGKQLNHDFGIQFIFYSLDTQADEQNLADPKLKSLLDKLATQPNQANSVTQLPYVVSPAITNTKKEKIRLIIRFPEHITRKFDWSWPDIISKLIIAFLISGLICYLLSLYLSRPIRILQRAARRLGRGELNTRVGKELHMRNDEIAELAFEFDDMASRLQTLVQNRQQLLHNISHELRSPLARLSVALEIARKHDSSATHELNRIEKECNNLNELISKILALASLNNQENLFAFTHVNVNKLLMQIIDDAHYETQSKHSQVQLIADEEYRLSANQPTLSSAFENIIRNAIRYSPENSQITVTVQKNQQDLQITIVDGGPGISEPELANIFEPFFRVNNARTTIGGYGLGLAIAKKAINMHRGKIVAENLEGGGLIIAVTLPVETLV